MAKKTTKKSTKPSIFGIKPTKIDSNDVCDDSERCGAPVVSPNRFCRWHAKGPCAGTSKTEWTENRNCCAGITVNRNKQDKCYLCSCFEKPQPWLWCQIRILPMYQWEVFKVSMHMLSDEDKATICRGITAPMNSGTEKDPIWTYSCDSCRTEMQAKVENGWESYTDGEPNWKPKWTIEEWCDQQGIDHDELMATLSGATVERYALGAIFAE